MLSLNFPTLLNTKNSRNGSFLYSSTSQKKHRIDLLTDRRRAELPYVRGAQRMWANRIARARFSGACTARAQTISGTSSEGARMKPARRRSVDETHSSEGKPFREHTRRTTESTASPSPNIPCITSQKSTII